MLRNAPNKSVDKDPFGFTGGLDAGNGKWKLGARFYDSSKSAFMQQDRYFGNPNDPLSLNRYSYCGLDPVNFVDPTGFSAVALVARHLGGAVLGGGMAFLGCALDAYINKDEKSKGEIIAVTIMGAVMGAVSPDMGIFSGFFSGVGISITQRIINSFDKNNDGKVKYEKRKDGYYIDGNKVTKKDVEMMKKIIKEEESEKKKKDD